MDATVAVLTRLVTTIAVVGLIKAQSSQTADTLVKRFTEETVFWKQFEVAKAIVATGNRTVLPKLEPWLINEDRHLRGNAAYVFASFGDDRGFEVIRRILEDHSERAEEQGSSVVCCISPVNPDRKAMFAPQVSADRYYAAHLLGDLKDSRAVPILLPLLRDKEVNHIIPWSLGEIGSKEAVQPLIETLKDPDADMRVLAIYALEKLQAKEALPAIQQLKEDQEKIRFDGAITVSKAAKGAVARLR